MEGELLGDLWQVTPTLGFGLHITQLQPSRVWARLSLTILSSLCYQSAQFFKCLVLNQFLTLRERILGENKPKMYHKGNPGCL